MTNFPGRMNPDERRDWSYILVGADESEDAQPAFGPILESHAMNVHRTLDENRIRGRRDDPERHLERYRARTSAGGVRTVKTPVV